MPIRKDFCALILTFNRPDRIHTIKSLKKHGYTGPVFLVVSDDDPALGEYRKRYKSNLVVFSKQDVSELFDEGDNFPGYRGVVYARNAAWGIVRELGFKYFIELDDDYAKFEQRFNESGEWIYKKANNLDDVFNGLVSYLESCPNISCLAMAQGGDFIGGKDNRFAFSLLRRRKVMNSFVCDADRPFMFPGRVNEDTTMYTLNGNMGRVFMTIPHIQLTQLATQQNKGGLSEIYLDAGTYVKSFYTVMRIPSAVCVRDMVAHNRRLHHSTRWPDTVPMIIREEHRKPRGEAGGK